MPCVDRKCSNLIDKRTKGIKDHLIRTVEARRDDFAYDIHKMLGFLNDVVDFAKCGRAAYRRLLHRELQLLNVGWDFI